jgi:TRAP-type C4-dicarboxylate transport system substrate-binding protein
MRGAATKAVYAVLPVAAIAGTFIPVASLAEAEPIELKLSFFASENSDAFRYGIRPFVDAVNGEGDGVLRIKVFADGALNQSLAEQPSMVLEGKADIAWVVPGQTPYRFPDNELLELPGLFRNAREGTLAYTRLIAAEALRGYSNFFVIGAFTSAPRLIHSRKPIESLASLNGLKIRVNNSVEASVLQRLGAIPTVVPASRVADAIAKGAVDAATFSPAGLYQFGAVPETVTYHYLLSIGVAPLVLLMNRKRFDNLPEPAKALIRKNSDGRAAAAWISSFDAAEKQSLEKIEADARRIIVKPSPADAQAAHQVYQSTIDSWATSSTHNQRLLRMLNAELASIRAGQQPPSP